jgi:predicted phosphodiesterase
MSPCGFLKTPFVQIIATDAVMIMWETGCRYDDVELNYQRRAAYRSGPKQQLHGDEGAEHRLAAHSIEMLVLGSHRFVHRVYLDHLHSDSLYEYVINLTSPQTDKKGQRVKSDAPFVATFYFPGEQAEQYSMGIVSDNHGATETFNQLVRGMSKRKPTLFMHLGDMVKHANRRFDWQVHLFDVLSRYGISEKIPTLITMGNHDRTEFGTVEYLSPPSKFNTKEMYYYSVTVGPARIIVLDCLNQDESQLQWLEMELSAIPTQRAAFRIVAVHYPLFVEYWDVASWKRGDDQWSPMIRIKLVALFEKYHVDLVLSGHQHNYQRGFRNGVHYIICGGGGGQLDLNKIEDHRIFKVTKMVHHYLWLDISKTTIELAAYDTANRLVDALSIPKNVIRRFRAAEP